LKRALQGVALCPQVLTRSPARQTPIFPLLLPPLLLQEAPEPGSTFGSVVKVLAVCWLELCGWFPGVLPGRYRVAWRVRLEVSGLAGRPAVTPKCQSGAGRCLMPDASHLGEPSHMHPATVDNALPLLCTTSQS
jgi:hypothetical protein